VAEYCTNLGHCNRFKELMILTTRTGRMELIIRVAIEIELHPDNINKESFPSEQVIETAIANI
jgi:hypothetical protein